MRADLRLFIVVRTSFARPSGQVADGVLLLFACYYRVLLGAEGDDGG